MSYTLKLENPNIRARRYGAQLDTNRSFNGQELTPTQAYYRTGYLMCMDDRNALALGKLDVLTEHPHQRAARYAQELADRQTSDGKSLDVNDVALRSGYLQCMRDAGAQWHNETALHNAPSARTYSFAEREATS